MTAALLVQDALRAAAPDSNVTGWIDEQADRLGVSPATFKAWLYGYSAPDLDHFLRLCAEYGASFIDAVLEGTGYRVASEEEAQRIDARRDCLDKIEEGARGLRALEGGS